MGGGAKRSGPRALGRGTARRQSAEDLVSAPARSPTFLSSHPKLEVALLPHAIPLQPLAAADQEVQRDAAPSQARIGLSSIGFRRLHVGLTICTQPTPHHRYSATVEASYVEGRSRANDAFEDDAAQDRRV